MCKRSHILSVYYQIRKRRQRDDPLKVPRLTDTEYDYDRLKERHIKDYKDLFDRVDFCLKSTDPDVEKLPTDQRLRGLAEGKSDNALYTLFSNTEDIF